MAYTDLDFLKTILDTRWETSITGRSVDVPKPKIVIATTEEETRTNTAQQDVIFVRDGGPQQVEPKSLGWTEESITTPLTVDIRTAQGRERFVGTRDANNNADRYGGLYGESKRVLQTIRKGEKEFTWAATPEWNDLSEDVGYGHWRGTWTVRLKQVAETIDTSP